MALRTPRVVIKIKDGVIKDILTYIEPRVEFLILNEDLPETHKNHMIFWITEVTPEEVVMEYFPEYHRF
jgi:hypothetical protein